MIDIKSCHDQCFAKVAEGCGVLFKTVTIHNCGNTCPFYKPTGCKDWVRSKTSEGVVLYTPEEYEQERSLANEQTDEKTQLYWHIKSVPVSKK